MPDSLTTNLELIRSLIERAPDSTVRNLETALGADKGGPGLLGVRSMVDAEMADRAARDQIFNPVKALFGPRADGVAKLSFPAAAYAQLWRAVKVASPQLSQAAIMDRPHDGVAPAAWDQLCAAAAAGLRERKTPDFAALARMLEGGPGADELASCLDLTPLARIALTRVPDWLQRMSEDLAATARLTYRDAVSIADDAGPRLFEIFFANLSEPWLVLRLICAVMTHPVDNYISGSELAFFCDRLLDDIDRRLDDLRRMDLDAGVEGAHQFSLQVCSIGVIANEFEQSLNLGREGPWGARLTKQKAAVAKLVEGLLKKADSTVAAALPLAPHRIGGRIVRMVPKLDAPPDPRAMRKARAVLTVVTEVRTAASAGGFSNLRHKACEEVEHRIGAYVEDLLAVIHDQDDNTATARLYMEELADLMGRVRDQQAAQLLRRRAAAA